MRTEGDTWDICNGVGSTAALVAAIRAMAGRGPEPLVVDPYAEIFARAASPEWADLLDGKVTEHALLDPSFGSACQLYHAARTRYFDDYCAKAMAAGVRQIVILAAGLDARAHRLPWPDGTTVYELDRLPVLEFKRRTLAANGDKPRADRREVPVDLREDWPKTLREHGFDPSKPTAWLVEGLLVYLPVAAVDRLFEDIELASAPGSRVAIEEIDQLPDQSLTEPADEPDSVIRFRKEWLGLTYNEQRSDAAKWFATRGWNTESVTLLDYLDSMDREAKVISENPQQTPAYVTLTTAVLRPS
ncbi:class I SAM-dependent methyltransferase [Nocardia sp. CS682]|uniref:class I SAM-dependent methyltransferase n=1 Tax=Nocardia sp. CS682 TaxID=1047172 RepID=UPI001074E2EA|nr:class I SAM-dependent methyltransferase [Nocardia sp. CS682]QBS46344.1 SAM-dependent methyltransferase [Nocardia sp. CS682]